MRPLWAPDHERPALAAESTPYKQNGWIGDQFIPYERKYKAVKDRRIYLCGICYAVKQAEEAREGGVPMTDLEQFLADLATKETATVPVAASSVQGVAMNKSRITRKPKRDKRPVMTADQARSFDSFSVGSTAMALMALSCACAPYVDLFTYKRWQAQKMQVIKGSKSIRLPLVKNVDTSRLFCRCQVDPMKAEVAA